MSENAKLCKGGCGSTIYWDDSVKKYKDTLTKQVHICPNWKKPNTNTNTNTSYSGGYNRGSYKKEFKPKEPVECSVVVCTGGSEYEKLSDLITEANGRIHGTQHNYDSEEGTYDFIVYFEVPVGKRSELTDRFYNWVNHLVEK